MPFRRGRGKVAPMFVPFRMLSARLGAVTLLAVLTGCSGPLSEPYYLGRWTPDDIGKVEVRGSYLLREAGTGRPVFSVCYNKLTHKAEQVRALVRKHCADPQLLENESDLYACSLSAPVRASYSCSALSRTAEEARPNLIRSDSSFGNINFN